VLFFALDGRNGTALQASPAMLRAKNALRFINARHFSHQQAKGHRKVLFFALDGRNGTALRASPSILRPKNALRFLHGRHFSHQNKKNPANVDKFGVCGIFFISSALQPFCKCSTILLKSFNIVSVFGKKRNQLATLQPGCNLKKPIRTKIGLLTSLKSRQFCHKYFLSAL
jgi:hypothetical protein